MVNTKEASELIRRIIGGTQFLFRHLLSGFVLVGVLWALHPPTIDAICGSEGASSKWFLPILSLVLGFVLYALNSATYHLFFYGCEVKYALRKLVERDKSYREKLARTMGIQLRLRERSEQDKKNLRKKAYERYLQPVQLDLARWRRRQGTSDEQAIQRGLDDWNSISHFLLTSSLALVIGSMVALVSMIGCHICNYRSPEFYLWPPICVLGGLFLYAIAFTNGIRSTMREITMVSECLPPRQRIQV